MLFTCILHCDARPFTALYGENNMVHSWQKIFGWFNSKFNFVVVRFWSHSQQGVQPLSHFIWMKTTCSISPWLFICWTIFLTSGDENAAHWMSSITTSTYSFFSGYYRSFSTQQRDKHQASKINRFLEVVYFIPQLKMIFTWFLTITFIAWFWIVVLNSWPKCHVLSKIETVKAQDAIYVCGCFRVPSIMCKSLQTTWWMREMFCFGILFSQSCLAEAEVTK